MILKDLLIYGVLIYAGLCVVAFFIQGRVLFPATRAIYRTPAAHGCAFEDVTLPVLGETTHGWFVVHPHARGVALFSHGNAGNIADRLESIDLLMSYGLSVLAYDYGGYGKSTGRPSEKRCYADAQAMWDWLTKTKGIPPEKIVLFGRSLGGGITADLAAKVKPAAVVLESTFLSTADVAAEMLPFLPMRWLIRYRFDNQSKVGKIRCPLLIIHSPDDTVIPYRNGVELFKLAPEPKRLLEIHGDHNDGFVLSMDAYRACWLEFLEPILGPLPPMGGASDAASATEN